MAMMRKNGTVKTVNKGIPQSAEAKAKQSDVMKAKYASGEYKHPRQGVSLSDELKNKIRDSVNKHLNEVSTEEMERRNIAREKSREKLLASGWVSPLKGRPISKEHKEKSIKTIQKASEIHKAKTWELIYDKADRYNLEILSREKNQINIKCKACENVFKFHFQIFRNSKNIGHKICPFCYPRMEFTSYGEQAIGDYIESLGISIERNNQYILPYRGEIDILVESMKIAIEFDGLYWHSEDVSKVPKNLISKTKRLNHLGYRVIHIFEDEWQHKPEIVMSRLQQILGKTDNRIYARHTIIKTIDNSTKNEFLEENHIQGQDVSKIRYGAFHDEELVAVMTFKPTNFSKGGDGSEIELSRFAVKKNMSIIGIASKLFKLFISDYNPDKVISYADRRWSEGGLYQSLGFVFDSYTPPNYWYWTSNATLRLHRANFMKHMLVAEGYDESKTEFEIMTERKYHRIYDCGSSKWIWNKQNKK